MSLYELIHEFLFDCKVRELSDQTITNYEKQLNKFRHFVKDNFQIIQFEDLKQIHVKQYISSLQDRGSATPNSAIEEEEAAEFAEADEAA